MKKIAFGILSLFSPLAVAAAGDSGTAFRAPDKGTIKVAFVLTDNSTVIDFSGPWEVFQDVVLPAHDNRSPRAPFELFTVGSSKQAIHTTGSNRPGMTITPDYTFANAPAPDIVVIGAQQGDPALVSWLQKVHTGNNVILSVCTGAFKVARAGFFNGKSATTHHWYFDRFAQEFPTVKLVRSVRYVESDATVYSAGGLTSGIDLALHIVSKYFGEKVAAQTAEWMEYQNTGWQSNSGVPEIKLPVEKQIWTGKIGTDWPIRLDVTVKGYGIDTLALATILPLMAIDVPATMETDGNKVHIDIDGKRASFDGVLDTAGVVVTGTMTLDGKQYPTSLTRVSDETDK